MASLFVSAGNGGFEATMGDSGAIAFGTTEAQEMMLTRDLLVAELRQRGIDTFSVLDIRSLSEFGRKYCLDQQPLPPGRCSNTNVRRRFL
jgi:hypothetical protein